MTYQVKITASGRLSLPAELRKRLGLSKGGDLLIEETANSIVLRTVAQAVANAQEIARRYTGDNPASSVDAFLAARRRDSGE
jgi:AbrB family looped-hinge helix DNA binding protein